jgi:mRNA interferase MazF
MKQREQIRKSVPGAEFDASVARLQRSSLPNEDWWVRRGEIWWASLGAPRGSESEFRRPVLIVQSDEFNASRIAGGVAVVLTSKIALAESPGNVVVRKRQSGLRRDSVANVSQVVPVTKAFLTEKAGELPVPLMALVDEGLRLVLSL